MLQKKPEHISLPVWETTLGLLRPRDADPDHLEGYRRLAGQLTQCGPATAINVIGCSADEGVARGYIGMIMGLKDAAHAHRMFRLALDNDVPVPLTAGDWHRGVKTTGPSGASESYCCNPELIRLAARDTARDMIIFGMMMSFSSAVDGALGDKQGRSQEGGICSSPRLRALYGVAHMQGLQGECLGDDGTVAACGKHQGMYQRTTAEDYTVDAHGERDWHEDVARPFEALLNAQVASLMRAFVEFNGTPAHASEYFAKLNLELGGPLVLNIGDYAALRQLVEVGVAGNEREAAVLAFINGRMHIDLNGGVFFRELPWLIRDRVIPLYDVCVRVAEVLMLKERLGLFKDPYRYGKPEEEHRLTALHPAKLRLAEACAVLLKPKKPEGTLPVPLIGSRILVTGPIAHNRRATIGEWSSNAWHPENIGYTMTTYDGLRNLWGPKNVTYVQGVDFEKPHTSRDAAIAAAREATHIVLHLGEDWNWSGESKVRLCPRVPPAQVRHFNTMRKANPRAKLIVIITAGRRLHIPNSIRRYAHAILWIGQLGTWSGIALANLLSGKAEFTGRLSHDLPMSEHLHSGYCFRRKRTERPAHRAVPNTATYGEAAWSSHFQELGEKAHLQQYSFGEGYSGRTTFRLSGRKLSAKRLSITHEVPIIATVTVTNTGRVAGTETVLMLMHDTVAEAVPRRLEHIGEAQVYLEPGESKTLRFKITLEDLRTQCGKDERNGRVLLPDRHPILLFLVQNARQADRVLGHEARMRRNLKFILAE